jgi:hypothetical protein
VERFRGNINARSGGAWPPTRSPIEPLELVGQLTDRVPHGRDEPLCLGVVVGVWCSGGYGLVDRGDA